MYDLHGKLYGLSGYKYEYPYPYIGITYPLNTAHAIVSIIDFYEEQFAQSANDLTVFGIAILDEAGKRVSPLDVFARIKNE